MTLSQLHMHLDNMLADYPEREDWQVFVSVMGARPAERIGSVSVENFANVEGGVRPCNPFVCLETHDVAAPAIASANGQSSI